MNLNIWHLVALLIGYLLGRDHADLSSVFIGLLGGLILLKLFGWGFQFISESTNVVGEFLKRPKVKNLASGVAFIISFVFTHWMLLFVSLILAMPVTYLFDAIISEVDTAKTLMVSTAILFPIIEIIYHKQFRKKKRRIFGFDV